MSLYGKKIIITRDRSQAMDFIRLLRQQGAVPLLLPTIQIIAEPNPVKALQAVDKLKSYDWLIFNSINAARYFLMLNGSKGIPASVKTATVGDKTADYLTARNIRVDIRPRQPGADGLLQAMENIELSGRRILIPASNLTLPILGRGLAKRGARVEVVTVYLSVQAKPDNLCPIKLMIGNGQIDAITFFSPSAVRFFCRILGETAVNQLRFAPTVLAAIGQSTARELTERIARPRVVAGTASVQAMIAALGEYFSQELIEGKESER